MIGMILEAGASRRLRPDTDELPKALLPVDGETTILDIALRNLAAVGMSEVVIVVGHAAHAIADPGTLVKISGYSEQMDWEIELAAVIGRTAKDVAADKALGYVAGYTIANDLSARDRGKRANMPDASPFKWDWTKHKTFDGSCPLGPWIVPASDIGDPQKLGLKLWVNGVLKQDSNTSEMIFTLAEQIAQLSVGMTLHPGDIILTGTPAGVGAGRGEFLKAGDAVKLWIENIGKIENRMI